VVAGERLRTLSRDFMDITGPCRVEARNQGHIWPNFGPMASSHPMSADPNTPSMPVSWDLPAPFVLPLTVDPTHIDLMQHTNNVHYLQWVEDMAWAHSTALGLGQLEYAALGHGMVVRQHELTYLQPTLLGQALLRGTWLVQIDRLCLWRQHQFVRAVDGQTVFRAKTHYVCVDIAQGKVRRMPEAFARIYGEAITPGAAT
jgi:acyl-CoA thioester hydrolase